MSLISIFRAGCVQRWHANPDLATTGDRIDGHSARVARILMALHPDPSRALIFAALTHDDGEIEAGDVMGPFKRARPDVAAVLEEVEAGVRAALWRGVDPVAGLTREEARWLSFADRLDAYIWAQHHAPHVLSGDGWPQARRLLVTQANELGCDSEVHAALEVPF